MLINTESKIANTTMQKYIDDKTGKEKTFWLKPLEGFRLHAKELDTENPETGEGEPGFTEGIATCSVKYDFTQNPREFYTIAVNI